MRGEMYNIKDFSYLNTVCVLKTILAELTTYFPGQMNLYYSVLVKDNFLIEYYGIGDGRTILLCPRLRSKPRTRRRFKNVEVIIRDVSDSETE